MKNDSLSSVFYHLRPGLWPFIWVHSLAGFVAAHGRDTLTLNLDAWLQGLVGGANWAVFLGGPAAVLTGYFGPSVLDSADGEGAPLPDAHPVPKSACLVAFAMILLGLILAMGITWNYFDAYLVGIIVLVANAAPPLRLADLTYGALAGQAFGYGVLPFYAGYAASNTPSTYSNTVPLYFFGFVFLFLALRLVFWRVPSRMAPWFYWTALLGAFGCLGGAGVLAGNRWSVALLVVPLAAWAVAGLQRYDKPEEESAAVGIVLGAWLLTDVAVGLTALLR